MKNTLRLIPKNIRMKIIEMAYKGQSSHIACSFSIVEIMTILLQIFFTLSK